MFSTSVVCIVFESGKLGTFSDDFGDEFSSSEFTEQLVTEEFVTLQTVTFMNGGCDMGSGCDVVLVQSWINKFSEEGDNIEN